VVFLEVESKNPPQPMPGNPDPQSGAASAPDDGVNLFDHVDYDSHVERTFAAQLENNREHAKLPRRFKGEQRHEAVPELSRRPFVGIDPVDSRSA
jgi:type III restriction enzyme